MTETDKGYFGSLGAPQGGASVRWDELFGDLEAQWGAEERRELDAEVADRTRRERAAVGLYERLSGADGRPVGLVLADGSRVSGPVVDVGDGWVLVGQPSGAALVPFTAFVAVTGLGSRVGGSATGRRFGLGYALRGLSRDRAVVAVGDVSGAVVTGTIDAVGRDHLELSEHPADLPRRSENVTGRRVVPFSALVLVRPA
ncbi:MAG TPA: hypothetical protein VGK60_00980 [Pedococcus sp.]